MPNPQRLTSPMADDLQEAVAMRRDSEQDVETAAMAPPWRVRIFDSFAAAEADWRQLEGQAVLTPNQRFDWLAPLHEVRGDQGSRLAIAVAYAGTRPVALLPLAIGTRLGVAVGELMGADIGNTGWMIVEPQAAAQLDGAALHALLADIGEAAGRLDAIVLHNLPASWDGLPNPLLALPHQPAPDNFYHAALEAGRPNTKRRRNIQRGQRRLEEAKGPVSLRQAQTAEEIDRVHAVFLAQRVARFGRRGVRTIFTEPWCIDFFRAAARRGLGSDRPALRFHALLAGEEIVATSCGIYCGTHYAQYINSAAADPQAAKASLMGLLLQELTVELRGEGITSIDMGLGDFAYKTDWTDRQTVFDAAVGLTGRGRMAAALLLRLRALKRAVKQNERLFVLIKRLRALASGAAWRSGASR